MWLTRMPFSNTNLDADETKAALARAFDAAWDRFIELEGPEAATDDNRKRLAGRIVELAKSGEYTEELLSDAGLIYIRVLAEAARLGQRNRVVSRLDKPEHFEVGAQAYGPDTIESMSAALARCIDELPLRTPSEAISVLSNSILDEASRGEHDPERLSHHALNTLKSRR